MSERYYTENLYTMPLKMMADAADPWLRLDFVDVQFVENKRPLAENYIFHQQRIAGKSVYRMDRQQALAVVHEHNVRRFERLLEIGAVRELKPREIDKLRQVEWGNTLD